MNSTKTIVLKFGGASVSSPERFSYIAKIIADKKKEFKNVVVVISAMSGKTDELIELANQVHPNPPKRELDMLVSVGERISISLLAMALDNLKVPAISFTGSQSGIITSNTHADARIVDIRPKRLLAHLEKDDVVIVAGFQGMSLAGDITTLGRGGSDTSAVAIAVALDAERVEFYKDVDGVFDSDPKKNAQAKLLKNLTYKDALDIVLKGAKILQNRCLELAEKNALPLHVLSFDSHENTGTIILAPNTKKPVAPLFES